VTPPEGPAQGRHKAVSMPKACGRDNCTPRRRGRQAGSAGIGRNPRSARSVAHSGWASDTGSKNRCNPHGNSSRSHVMFVVWKAPLGPIQNNRRRFHLTRQNP